MDEDLAPAGEVAAEYLLRELLEQLGGSLWWQTTCLELFPDGCSLQDPSEPQSPTVRRQRAYSAM